jgi:hypothetical protein
MKRLAFVVVLAFWRSTYGSTLELETDSVFPSLDSAPARQYQLLSSSAEATFKFVVRGKSQEPSLTTTMEVGIKDSSSDTSGTLRAG